MSRSLLSLIFWNGSVDAVDKVRLALETNSAFWFRLVKYSGYAVAFGCVLEAPETFVIIKRWWLLRFRGEEHEETQGQKKSWIIPLAAAGLIIIVLGIVAETYFEGKVSDVDALLRAHESDKITAAEEDAASAIRNAGTAKDSAGDAELIANRVKAKAEELDKDVVITQSRADLLNLPQNLDKLKKAILPFKGQKAEVRFAYATQFHEQEIMLAALALDGLLDEFGWSAPGPVPDEGLLPASGIFVEKSPRASQSTGKAASALAEALTSILIAPNVRRLKPKHGFVMTFENRPLPRPPKGFDGKVMSYPPFDDDTIVIAIGFHP